MGVKSKIPLVENVYYELRDKEGNTKKLFQDGLLNRFIYETVRKFYNPYHANGEQKTGVLAHLALYGLRIPFLTGNWVSKLLVANGVTNTGMAGVASRINGDGSEAAFTYIAVGTGVGAFSAADTTLGTETAASGLSRAAATASRVTTDVTNDTAQLVKTFTVTGTVAVTESGVLNAASVGVLLCRQTFSAINVVNGDSLQVTWKIDVD